MVARTTPGDLLTAIERTGLWSVPISWQVQLAKGQVISTSAPQIALTPVQPHNGKMVPLDEKGNGAEADLPGSVADHEFPRPHVRAGSGLRQPVFIYGGVLEVNPLPRLRIASPTPARPARRPTCTHGGGWRSGPVAGRYACSVDVEGQGSEVCKEVTTRSCST